jgi:hypothetical protein
MTGISSDEKDEKDVFKFTSIGDRNHLLGVLPHADRLSPRHLNRSCGSVRMRINSECRVLARMAAAQQVQISLDIGIHWRTEP